MAIDISINAPDAYIWCATYHDDTQIPEYDHERTDGRGFAEVDKSQVKVLGLLPLRDPSLPAHCVIVPENAEIVFFRRRPLVAFQGTDEPNLMTWHCIGWKSDTDVCYLFVADDGSSLLTNNLQAVRSA